MSLRKLCFMASVAALAYSSLALAAARPAVAQEEPPPAEPSAREVSAAMTTYFRGEKRQGYGWGGVGAASLMVGAGLFVEDRPFERAASYPILIVGAIESVIAVLSFVRPEGRIKANDEKLAANPRGFLDEERARIRTVNRFFVGVELFETAVAVTGISLMGAGLHEHDRSMQGVGLGLVAQGAAMFVLDSVAHARAERYERLLLGGAATKDGATLSLGTRF